MGAIAGYWMGNFFDESYKNFINRNRMNGQKSNRAFFEATFSVMGHLAKADGRVSVEEVKAARTAMNRLNLNTQQQQEAIELFNKGKKPDFHMEPLLNALVAENGHDVQLIYLFMELQIQAALADGHLHANEKQILMRICKYPWVLPPRI